MCSYGYGDCDGKGVNGCEVNLSTDVNNCGKCGAACPMAMNATPGCKGGACQLQCAMNFADCDGKPDNGCETPVSSDGDNCGGCGVKCVANNCSTLCAAGTCQIQMCNKGFADCDGDPKNGCEASLDSPLSCGKCGTVCKASPHATPGCVAEACGVGLCDALWGDCNGDPSDGCELPLDKDLKNCGKCNNVCPAAANGVPACVMGKCVVGSCNNGWGDCNMDLKDGCEDNLLLDAKNCGACGNACPNNAPFCNQGKCQSWCSNGSVTDCNTVGGTLKMNQAFVDTNPPQFWQQCFGFTNSLDDDVSAGSMDNCLLGTKLRMRVFDANKKLVLDIEADNISKWGSWPLASTFLDMCNCNGPMLMNQCLQGVWPCGNTAMFTVSTNGVGSGNCGGFQSGGPVLSNPQATPFNVAVAETNGQELWSSKCYGDTQYLNYSVAIFK
jgi:hypothetical protein